MNVSLVGSGSLSLGLLYPWLSTLSGCHLSVISREGKKSEALRASRQYVLQTGDQSRRISFSSQFLTYDPKDLDTPDAEACVELLRESDVVAVSVGVGRLKEVSALLARACTTSDCPPLHLLAFENTRGASRILVREIEKALEQTPGVGAARQLVAHTAIPDRACGRSLGQDSIVIRTERFGEILLEDSVPALFAEASASNPPIPIVRHVSTDAVPLGEIRKFWLVNGTHTALGVLCADQDLHLLTHGLDETEIAVQLQDLHAEWVQVLHKLALERGQAAGVFTSEELTAHAARMFERLRDLPDFSVLDVLRELSDLEKVDEQAKALHRLFQKLDDRLAGAVRAAGEVGGIAVPVSGRVLATGVGTVRQYADTSLM
ncbi:MAG TPA: hypothetical protein VGP73_03030 [Thermoanaerobaculia bacterium]